MNLVKKIYSKNIVSILDYGAESVIVLVGEKEEGGNFTIIGAGNAASQGIREGEIVHRSDAAESIVEALKKAERSSGLKIEKLYYNFDDGQMQSVFMKGSKVLDGEGEIRSLDIEAARKLGERLAGDFERSAIYSAEVRYIIDDRDDVVDPIGVYGKKLDVLVHILQARSGYLDEWNCLIQRAQLFGYTPVFSCWSTAYGILGKDDRLKRRLIVDMGRDYLNVFIFCNGKITAHRIKTVFGENPASIAQQAVLLANELIPLNPVVEETLVTGDCAQEPSVFNEFEGKMPMPLKVAVPTNIPKLSHPKYASAIGLLSVAEEIESKMPILRTERGILSNAKQKALSFINEYF